MRRTSLQILSDVLEITKDSGQNGIKQTHLIHRANLSYLRLKPIIKKLMGNGLVNKIEFDGRKTIIITEKGKLYLDHYKKFSDLGQDFGFDL